MGLRARALEPALSDKIGMAVRFPDNRSMKDPYKLVLALAERFQALGGRMETGAVVGFTRSDRITGVQLADGRALAADEVVICAGAFSARLSKLLDEPIPLETERGYHTQIMAPGIEMRHSIIWPARAFMVTPTAGGIRVGGTVEMAGLEAAPDYRRAKVTVRRAQTALPGLRCADFTEWMGHRPALPDTVPILSASAKTRRRVLCRGAWPFGADLRRDHRQADRRSDHRGAARGGPAPLPRQPFLGRFADVRQRAGIAAGSCRG